MPRRIARTSGRSSASVARVPAPRRSAPPGRSSARWRTGSRHTPESSRSDVSATASAPSMFTGTGFPVCLLTRAASARTAASCRPSDRAAANSRSRSARRSEWCHRWPMPGRRRPAARSVSKTSIRPCVEAALGRDGGEDPHRPADHGPVQLAEGEDPARKPAHRSGAGRGDGAGHQGRRRERPVVDRGDEARAQQGGLVVGRRVAAPEPQQHRRERFAPDRLIQGNAAHEDALVGRGRDRRRPGLGLVGLAGGRTSMRSGAHCATW